MNQRTIFLKDTLLIASLESDWTVKTAQADSFVSGLSSTVSSYISGHIDPNDKVGSLANILAPGAFAVFLTALNFPKIGFLVGLLMNIFHVDVAGIVRSIWADLMPHLDKNGKVSSGMIDQAVSSAVSSVGGSLGATSESDVRLLKIALISYAANPRSQSWYDKLTERNGKAIGIFGRIVSWIFKIAFASAGLMIAGDIINKFVGRPNAIDGTLQHGKEVAPSAYTPKQTKFKVNTSYHDEKMNSQEPWQENIQNDLSSIEEMLADFVQEVYDVKDRQLILGSTSLKMIADKIAWYNHASEGAPMIFLPKYFTSKKQIADYIIDDVAERSPQTPDQPAP